VQDPGPNLDQYDSIRETWRSKDMVAKVLGIFSANRLNADWKIAQPDDNLRKQAVKNYYKPTENPTLMNYHFRALQQSMEETFPSFCNRVLKESKHFNF